MAFVSCVSLRCADLAPGAAGSDGQRRRACLYCVSSPTTRHVQPGPAHRPTQRACQSLARTSTDFVFGHFILQERQQRASRRSNQGRARGADEPAEPAPPRGAFRPIRRTAGRHGPPRHRRTAGRDNTTTPFGDDVSGCRVSPCQPASQLNAAGTRQSALLRDHVCSRSRLSTRLPLIFFRRVVATPDTTRADRLQNGGRHPSPFGRMGHLTSGGDAVRTLQRGGPVHAVGPRRESCRGVPQEFRMILLLGRAFARPSPRPFLIHQREPFSFSSPKPINRPKCSRRTEAWRSVSPWSWELAIQLRRDIKPVLDAAGVKLLVGSDGQCSPRHPTHFEPSFPESKHIL